MTNTATMSIIDLNGPDGPFWALYQEERRASGILHDPDFVPFWFLEKLARQRLAAARVGLELLGTRAGEDAHAALRRLEDGLLGSLGLDEREQVVLGVLGAQEAATRVELEQAGWRPRFIGCPACHRELGSSDGCDHCLGARDAAWIGDAFARIAGMELTTSLKMALTKALYGVIRDGALPDWEVRVPRAIRFWGMEPPLNAGRLALSVRAAEAWLAQR